MTQPKFPIHSRLPQGFHTANDSQVEHYLATGFVPGASKVAAYETPPAYARSIDFRLGEHLGVDEPLLLGFRLRPPRLLKDIKSTLGRRAAEKEYGGGDPQATRWYIDQYNKGWAAASREFSREWDSGMSSDAFDDGYLDRAAGRAKWHLTYCLDHDVCGEG